MTVPSKLVSFGPVGTGARAVFQSSVSTTGALLRGANASRTGYSIQNLGPGKLYVGYHLADVTVTSANSMMIDVGQSIADPDPGTAPYLGALYAVSASTSDVRFAEDS